MHVSLVGLKNFHCIKDTFYTFTDLYRKNKLKLIAYNGLFSCLIILYSSVFGVALFLMILSTLYDVIVHRITTQEPNKLFITFSIRTNGRKLFDMTENKSSINSLHGIRALSLLWIMFGHRITNQLSFPIRNHGAVFEFYQQLYSVILYSYSISVDTFFLMGGLLLTMSTLRAIDNNTLNILRMILHRYLRYTPVFAVSILCTITLPKYLATGPLELNEFGENCIDYWWSSLLHIQNYVNPDRLCLNHTWYCYLFIQFRIILIHPKFLTGISRLIFNFSSFHHL